MKKTNFELMQDKMILRFGAEKGNRIAENMAKEYQPLCASYAEKEPGMERHARRNILPVVTAFHAMMDEGIEREQAAKLASDAFLELMQVPARTIRKALKVPGLYRLMPWLWKKLMPKMFSESSGFRFSFYPTDGKQVKFDMTACPYQRICHELDCDELAPTFCTTDDVCYGHMHPKLIWNRTKTLARGGDKCDFDLYIPKK